MFLALSWIYLCGVVLQLEFPVTGGPVSVATGDVFIEIIWLTYSLSLRSLKVSSLIV